MIAFGVFVLLVVGVIAGFAVVASDDPAVVHLLGFDFETTERWQFAIGALCALSAVVAVRIIVVGWRRARRRRRELLELRETVSQQTTPVSKHRDEPVSKHRDDRKDRDQHSAEPERAGSAERDHFDSTPRD
jgi:type VI protein secretion system component VasK